MKIWLAGLAMLCAVVTVSNDIFISVTWREAQTRFLSALNVSGFAVVAPADSPVFPYHQVGQSGTGEKVTQGQRSATRPDFPISVIGSNMGLTGTLMLHAGFILFGFVLAIVYTLCQRSKSSSRLVMRLTENNQTARAAHDSLLQNVNSLVLQLHAMAIHFRDEDAVRAALDHILKDAELLVEPGRYQIVGQQILPQYECDLEQMLAELAQALSEDGVFQCTLIVVGDYSSLYFFMHDDLYRFAREALTNAYRHACAQKVEIELTYTCMGLRLQIRDDGTGFPLLPHLTAGMTGSGGLHAMQKHASDIGGYLYISSGSGLGTEVSLDVPLPAQQERHYLTATLACMRRHLGFRS